MNLPPPPDLKALEALQREVQRQVYEMTGIRRAAQHSAAGDAARHGIGVLYAGRHIPLDEFFVQPSDHGKET